MGMFDNVSCNYPLPEHKEFQHSLFQTKDTPYQYLGYYRITKNGKLQFAEKYNEAYKTIKDYDGAISFYDIPEGGGWVEYKAVFVDGKLVKLKFIEYATKSDEQN